MGFVFVSIQPVYIFWLEYLIHLCLNVIINKYVCSTVSSLELFRSQW